MTVNQRVVGSSPTGGALKIKGLHQLQPFFSLLFRHISDTCPALAIILGLIKSNKPDRSEYQC